ncbi:related to ATP-dependent RNA helicase MSS116, mitochondrial [Saccharomycodes ludwigii]|uniref:ATP-dependent RNA helicase n=1 Tax=Saccharomycodes ludwigii TaxID=36035 RepID=A0A376B1D6_9ASCO|nr:hypothetical protein SCDLUD_001873 [Saccharomycodes ludwigii]KAH3902062.1 hypothetical protein SCDLUD_001873 [Saccharomycodes ludwigii]SSD58294.1 related to ATP-dependent RNA helicase MSS116, mitochondrial [Saccharomycodes ludwigii]
MFKKALYISASQFAVRNVLKTTTTGVNSLTPVFSSLSTVKRLASTNSNISSSDAIEKETFVSTDNVVADSKDAFTTTSTNEKKNDIEKKDTPELLEKLDENVHIDSLKDANLLDASIHKALDRQGFRTLTPVQSKAIIPILSQVDSDIITRAKTGTGKTLAFLIPIFQHLVKTRRESQYMVRAIIVAPTRDLAIQIENEIEKVFYKNNYGLQKFETQLLIGGTNLRESIKRMEKKRPNIVVATPGRLKDVLSDERVAKRFFKFVDFKVFDEADTLLEVGFREEMEEISDMLNEINENGLNHIRTLLFSATFNDKVEALSNKLMRKENNTFIDTVDENEPEVQEKVDQHVTITSNLALNILSSLEYIKKNMDTQNSKIIVFCPSTKFTSLYGTLLTKVSEGKFPVYTLHGKLQQNTRTNIVARFKKQDTNNSRGNRNRNSNNTSGGVLVCTDVGARGMDYPNINQVVQVGVPTKLANYIHRIGRTARAGKTGKSMLFLTKAETNFLDALSEIKQVTIENQQKVSSFEDEQIKDVVCKVLAKDIDLTDEAFTTILGFYKGVTKEYRLNFEHLCKDVGLSYTELLRERDIDGDKEEGEENEDKKLYIPQSFVKNVIQVPNRRLVQWFNLGKFVKIEDNGFENKNNRFNNSRGSFNNKFNNRYNQRGSTRYNNSERGSNNRNSDNNYGSSNRNSDNNYGSKYRRKGSGKNPSFHDDY